MTVNDTTVSVTSSNGELRAIQSEKRRQMCCRRRADFEVDCKKVASEAES